VFAPDGSRLAVLGGSVLGLWDLKTGLFRELDSDLPVEFDAECRLSFSPDGSTLALAGVADRLLRYDIESGRSESWRIPGFTLEDCTAFSADGRMAAFGINWDRAPRILLWDLTRGRDRATIAEDRVGALDFSPDGRVLALTSLEGGVHFFATEDTRHLGSYLWHTEHSWTLAFSPDGNWAATSSRNQIKLWPVRALLPPEYQRVKAFG